MHGLCVRLMTARQGYATRKTGASVGQRRGQRVRIVAHHAEIGVGRLAEGAAGRAASEINIVHRGPVNGGVEL